MNAVKSRLMTVASTFGWDAQSIEQADYDKLSKYTQQYINSQGLSARSDQALASAVTGNPGSHVSTLANKDVWPVLLGMERMNQMINTDFKSQSGKPADFGNFASNWQNTHDPRAFLIDQMDGPQRTKMLASMTNEQKTAYYRTLKLVDQNPGVMLTAPMPGH
jgi:uncharacterized Zn-finger protein